MTINEIENKYLINDSKSSEKFHFTHIFSNSKETKELHPSETLYSLKVGLDRIVKYKLGIYLHDGLKSEEEDSVIEKYLIENGLPKENIK
jgi:hypothetical protein